MSGRFGAFDGLLDVVGASWPLFGDDAPAPQEVSRRLREAIGVPDVPGVGDADVRVEQEWTRDGLLGRELSWDAGFGPRVRARLLRPAAAPGPLPTALFLHCHGGLKRFGLDKLADGATGRPVHPVLTGVRAGLYGGRAPAEDLARRGHAVLVHDAHGWGSRRLPVEAMPVRGRAVADLALAARAGEELDEAAVYDVHAGAAEDTVAKALALVGTSWAGVIAREDLLALDVLHHLEGGLDEGTAPRTALIGLSGGGARAVIASALRPGPDAGIGAVVVAAMVSTLREMVPEHVHSHTWAFMTPSLARVADWPDVVAAAAPRPLYVHYATRDALFPPEGMRRAHDLITRRYAGRGAPQHYRGVFREVPHSFDAAAQAEVHDWLQTLDVPAGGAR
ncbi:alpha/beta hydrolase family protein [Kineococcus sp. SYSU DK001]|uniref:alpha/beta hydrolase family protein n=1 Tax=Kineococcus sp. SYSU DK001 TaxID=3383122 RepID=UPI003D7CE2E2